MIILAVDDAKLQLEALMEAIRKAEADADIHGFRKVEDALAFARIFSCDVAFLDIDMRGMNGIELAKKLKLIKPDMNIIFATGYDEYMGDALALHCSGYLMKPITPEKVRKELDDLRHSVQPASRKRVCFQAFGNFEVFVDGKPLVFRYEKTKEMLAYLVDRCGSLCTNGEIMAVLWEDDTHSSYLRGLKKDLLDALKKYNCTDIIIHQRGKMGIIVENVDCDYYAWRKGSVRAINKYRGEYMSQYGWAEATLGVLDEEKL